MSTSVRFLLVFSLTVATAATAAPRTSVVSVTPLPHWQARVCWTATSDADAYWIQGSQPVENVFTRLKTSGIVCRDVNVIGTTECAINVATVSTGSDVNGDVTFGGQSQHFHFMSTGTYAMPDGAMADEFLAPPPVCSPSDRYPSIEAAESMAPSAVGLTDITRDGDPAPRIRLNLTCPSSLPNHVSTVRKYEIYENTITTDGSTATRTTSRDSCPNDVVLTGEWGARTTVTVAAIYDSAADRKPSHTMCTAPRTLTYGGAIVGTPRLQRNANAIGGSIGGGKADDVLLFVNAAEPYKLTTPDLTLSSSTFTAPVTLKRGFNRVYAVARRKTGSQIAYSEPAELLLHEGAVTAPVITNLSPFELTGQLYVAGTAAPSSPVAIEILRGNESVFKTTLYSCSSGEFGSDLRFGHLPAGSYRITATTPGAKQPFGAAIQVGEIAPQPAISLDAGPGPFWSGHSSIIIAGKITPRLDSVVAEKFSNDPNGESTFVTQTKSGYRLLATVNGKEIAVEPEDDSSFSFEAPVDGTTNRIRLEATAALTGQSSPPVEITVRFGVLEAGDVYWDGVVDALARGWKAIESDVKSSIDAFSDAIKANPRASAGYTGRAAAYITAGDAKSAFADASRAIELDPRDFRAWSYRSNDLLEQGKNAEAAESADRSIELDSSWGMPFANRARAHLNGEQFAAAVADASRAIEINNKDAYNYRVRALAYSHLGRNSEALEDIRRALELEPSSTEGLWIHAKVLTAYREFDKAVAEYQKLMAAEPDAADSYENSIAWTLYQKGDLQSAMTHANESIRIKPTAFAYGTRGWIRYASGDRRGALEDIEKANAIEPNYGGSNIDGGLAEFIRGNDARAVALWEQALDVDRSQSAAVTPLLREARAHTARNKK